MSAATSSSSAPIDILITGPMYGVGDIPAEGLAFHKLWEIADQDAFLRDVGPRLRGLAAGGRRFLDGAFLDRCPGVKIIANFGVGYDRVDVGAARERGIVVTNTPDVLTEEVADLAMGLLLATLRQLPQADRFVRAGLWKRGAFPLTASLRGRKVGILGLGRIGKAIARRIAASDVEVVYHGRSPQSGVPYAYYSSPLELAQAVDVLINVVPGQADTDGMIDAAVLAALGPDGVFINVGRGTTVDEAALVEALRSRTILAAGLDVFADEPNVPDALLTMDNTVLLPHAGSGSVHTRQAMGQLVVDNLIAWFAGRGPLTPVAETPWAAGTPYRP